MEREEYAFFRGLKALSATTFPKHCKVCGKVYENADQFFSQTQGIQNQSGLKSTLDDEDQPIVELFRNCSCGSTLLSSFSDRRDASAEGVGRRDLFGQLLGMLISKGIEPMQARAELLKFIRGERSALLEKMGLDGKS